MPQSVFVVNENGLVIDFQSLQLATKPGTLAEGYFYDEDTNFTAAASPKVLLIGNKLGCQATDGWIVVDGAGDIQVEVSKDNTPTWGAKMTYKSGEKLTLSRLGVCQIRLTHSGTNSAWRCLAN